MSCNTLLPSDNEAKQTQSHAASRIPHPANRRKKSEEESKNRPVAAARHAAAVWSMAPTSITTDKKAPDKSPKKPTWEMAAAAETCIEYARNCSGVHRTATAGSSASRLYGYTRNSPLAMVGSQPEEEVGGPRVPTTCLPEACDDPSAPPRTQRNSSFSPLRWMTIPWGGTGLTRPRVLQSDWNRFGTGPASISPCKMRHMPEPGMTRTGPVLGYSEICHGQETSSQRGGLAAE